MSEQTERNRISAAIAGDQDEFQRLIDPHRRELLVHCYRMLGSVEDAEDVLQETWLRAWRRLETFAGRAPLRAWLYKIATNACLDAFAGRRARTLPTANPPADPRDQLPGPINEPYWLEPLPDTLLDGLADNPEARYLTRESVRLAFLAALQNLPGRQRAVLILRDVLGWRANEAAELLDMTVPAVNSALQRARNTVKQRPGDIVTGVIDPKRNERMDVLLTRYVQAWEATDSKALVMLLREDAALTMPPLPVWYRGRADVQRFLDTYLFADRAAGRFRLVATQANGSPAFAVYQRDEAGVYRPGALHVLTIVDGQIAEIHDFLAFDERLFTRFNLPLVG